MALMLETIVVIVVVVLMLLLIFFIVFFYCKPWRFFFPSRSRTVKVGELERPLVSNNGATRPNQTNALPIDYDVEGARHQNDGDFVSPQMKRLFQKARKVHLAPVSSQGDSLALDTSPDCSEDVLVGQTLKRPLLFNQLAEERKLSKKIIEQGRSQPHLVKDTVDERSSLTLEVISGPSKGLRFFVQSTNSSKLPITLGRVPPSDLLLKDTEVSGKHAMINWNLNNLTWELRDMGSLNGTLLNAIQIHRSESGNRVWGEAFQLTSGDIISLGTTSKILAHIGEGIEGQLPFGVGVASDPMAMRRGGKKFPMEDTCYYECPLSGVEQFGLFCICDGHGGADAAKNASRLLSKTVTTNLLDSPKRERLLSLCDASDLLRSAFSQTEASLSHQYEGCTATLLLVWNNGDKTLYAQCANVGDSACVINVGTKQFKMTEDHRVTSHTERRRIEEMGVPLRDEETRICGLNLARMLGDKFLKEQDTRFSSEPYISKVVHFDQASGAFAIMASDGLWDVMSIKKAAQLVLQVREKYPSSEESSAVKIANYLLNEARTLRTKDNTSVIYLDFDSVARTICRAES